MLGPEAANTSDKLKGPKAASEGHWVDVEHARFLKGICLYGKDWKAVEEYVQTRKGSQVRSHAQKFFIKLGKIRRERKKLKRKGLLSLSDVERVIKAVLDQTDITDKTPAEITQLLFEEDDEPTSEPEQPLNLLHPLDMDNEEDIHFANTLRARHDHIDSQKDIDAFQTVPVQTEDIQAPRKQSVGLFESYFPIEDIGRSNDSVTRQQWFDDKAATLL